MARLPVLKADEIAELLKVTDPSAYPMRSFDDFMRALSGAPERTPALLRARVKLAMMANCEVP
jgi:hypothetical protein